MSADETIMACPDCGTPCFAFRSKCDKCGEQESTHTWQMPDGRTGSLMDLLAALQAEAEVKA